MLWRTLRSAAVLGVISVAVASACGGNSSSPAPDTQGGGAGKTATGGAPSTTKCGTATCKAVVLPVGDFTIPPCCADEATSQCGLDSSVLAMFGPTFPDACQPLNQPGNLDAHCADSQKTPVAGTSLEIQFQGCCRDNGSCGYMLDKLAGLFPLGLGCVDSAPFIDGGTPAQCGGDGGASSGG